VAHFQALKQSSDVQLLPFIGIYDQRVDRNVGQCGRAFAVDWVAGQAAVVCHPHMPAAEIELGYAVAVVERSPLNLRAAAAAGCAQRGAARCPGIVGAPDAAGDTRRVKDIGTLRVDLQSPGAAPDVTRPQELPDGKQLRRKSAAGGILELHLGGGGKRRPSARRYCRTMSAG